MRSCHPWLASGALALALMPWLLVQSEGAAGSSPKWPMLPDAAYHEIVKEASGFIQQGVSDLEQKKLPPDTLAFTKFRPNALLIALAAQQRMAQRGADARQAATLRDIVVQLAHAAEPGKFNSPQVKALAGKVGEFPNIKTDPSVSLHSIRLKDIFDHEDHIALFQFRGDHKIEKELILLTRKTIPTKPMGTPPPAPSSNKLELLGYKIALLGEMIRDHDDFVAARKADRRPEWVAHAAEVQIAGWKFAEAARTNNAANVKLLASRVNNACNECHGKFRCD